MGPGSGGPGSWVRFLGPGSCVLDSGSSAARDLLGVRAVGRP